MGKAVLLDFVLYLLKINVRLVSVFVFCLFLLKCLKEST